MFWRGCTHVSHPVVPQGLVLSRVIYVLKETIQLVHSKMSKDTVCAVKI